MNLKEHYAEQRVVDLVLRELSTLRRICRSEFPTTHPKEAVRHITSEFLPLELRIRVEGDLELDKKFLLSNVHDFFSSLKLEAEQCERYLPLHKSRVKEARTNSTVIFLA
jgi:hypothetical protein